MFQSLDAEKNDNTSKIIEKLTFMNLKLTGNNSAFSEIVLYHGYFFSFHSINIWMKIFATFVEVFGIINRCEIRREILTNRTSPVRWMQDELNH